MAQMEDKRITDIIVSFVQQNSGQPPTVHEAGQALVGSLSASVNKFAHDALFGVLKRLNRDAVLAKLKALVATGVLTIDGDFKLRVAPKPQGLPSSHAAQFFSSSDSGAPQPPQFSASSASSAAQPPSAKRPRSADSGAGVHGGRGGPFAATATSSSSAPFLPPAAAGTGSSSRSSSSSNAAAGRPSSDMAWLLEPGPGEGSSLPASSSGVSAQPSSANGGGRGGAAGGPLASASAALSGERRAGATPLPGPSLPKFQPRPVVIEVVDPRGPAGAELGATSSAAAHSSAPLGDPDADLSPEQQGVYDLVVSQGRSVFFTGSAGTGKSHLLRKMIGDLRRKFEAMLKPDAVFVTAPTGIAACNIGGTTIHSFAGIGKGDGDARKLAVEIQGRPAAAKRWRSAMVLVVDEVSMLDADLFDKLEEVARRVRHTDRPFGGLQLVLAGDFLQLPPVEESHSYQKGGQWGKGGGSSSSSSSVKTGIKFAFEAASWSKVVYAQVMLKHVFRQKDPRFVAMLNELRVGLVSPATETALRNAGATVAELQRRGTQPTRIHAVNADVDRVNTQELSKCTGVSLTYDCADSGSDPHLSTLQRNCPAAEKLVLKVGAQVMLLKNTDPERSLVNGSRGRVVGFAPNTQSQWPLQLPLVEFEQGTKAQSVTVPVGTADWTVELGGQVMASRTQIPLKLAWALSIHKSQGMGIGLLDVHLDRVFEFGQAYVALSRAVSLDRVRVTGFKASCVKAHPRVLEFYTRLQSTAAAASGSRPAASSAAGSTAPFSSSGNGSAAVAAPFQMQRSSSSSFSAAAGASSVRDSSPLDVAPNSVAAPTLASRAPFRPPTQAGKQMTIPSSRLFFPIPRAAPALAASAAPNGASATPVAVAAGVGTAAAAHKTTTAARAAAELVGFEDAFM